MSNIAYLIWDTSTQVARKENHPNILSFLEGVQLVAMLRIDYEQRERKLHFYHQVIYERVGEVGTYVDLLRRGGK